MGVNSGPEQVNTMQPAVPLCTEGRSRAAVQVVLVGSVFLALAPARVQGEPATGTSPNVLFLLADQWRASATGYAGDPNVQTPNPDRLAEEGVNSRNAISVCPVCTPYRAALMTGRYPTTTGMFLNDAHLPASELAMAEIFRDAGYTTSYAHLRETLDRRLQDRLEEIGAPFRPGSYYVELWGFVGPGRGRAG